MKPEIRYRYETTQRTKAEALAERARRIQEAQDEIRHRMAQIQECRDFIKAEAERPLPMTYEKQVEVREGEPGFEDLPPLFDLTRYQGNFVWGNHPN